MIRGLVLAAIQLALLGSVGGKFVYDRATLPRCWARSVPYDPDLPIRGRYVSLRLEVERSGVKDGYAGLAVRDGKLVAIPRQSGEGVWVLERAGGTTMIGTPIAFFIPEHVKDPSLRAPGEELWVEVSVPRNGPPRPIRLGVKKNGVLTPLPLD